MAGGGTKSNAGVTRLPAAKGSTGGTFTQASRLAMNGRMNAWRWMLTAIALTLAGCWMGVGNIIMYRMVNFRI